MCAWVVDTLLDELLPCASVVRRSVRPAHPVRPPVRPSAAQERGVLFGSLFKAHVNVRVVILLVFWFPHRFRVCFGGINVPSRESPDLFARDAYYLVCFASHGGRGPIASSQPMYTHMGSFSNRQERLESSSWCSCVCRERCTRSVRRPIRAVKVHCRCVHCVAYEARRGDGFTTMERLNCVNKPDRRARHIAVIPIGYSPALLGARLERAPAFDGPDSSGRAKRASE